jgi:hypothetical protein
VKVVEGQEIYNFAIHCLDHFCSTFWSFGQSNRATWKYFGHPVLQSMQRDAGRQAVRCRRISPHRGPGTDAEAPRAPRGLRGGIGRCVCRPSSPFCSCHASAVTAPTTQLSRRRTGAYIAVARAHAATPRPWHARHCPTALVPVLGLSPSTCARKNSRATPTPEPPHCHSRPSRRAPVPLVFPAAQPSRHLPHGLVKLPEPHIARLGRHLADAPTCGGECTTASRYPFPGAA